MLTLEQAIAQANSEIGELRLPIVHGEELQFVPWKVFQDRIAWRSVPQCDVRVPSAQKGEALGVLCAEGDGPPLSQMTKPYVWAAFAMVFATGCRGRASTSMLDRDGSVALPESDSAMRPGCNHPSDWRARRRFSSFLYLQGQYRWHEGYGRAAAPRPKFARLGRGARWPLFRKG